MNIYGLYSDLLAGGHPVAISFFKGAPNHLDWGYASSMMPRSKELLRGFAAPFVVTFISVYHHLTIAPDTQPPFDTLRVLNQNIKNIPKVNEETKDVQHIGVAIAWLAFRIGECYTGTCNRLDMTNQGVAFLQPLYAFLAHLLKNHVLQVKKNKKGDLTFALPTYGAVPVRFSPPLRYCFVFSWFRV